MRQADGRLLIHHLRTLIWYIQNAQASLASPSQHKMIMAEALSAANKAYYELGMDVFRKIERSGP
jgi:hypothetical protein